MYYIYGVEVVVYLLILWLSVLLSYGYNINFIFTFKLSPTMGRGKCAAVHGLQDHSHHVAEGI